MNILLFAGTSDGRALAERLASLSLRMTACVATEYGQEALSDLGGKFTIHTARMDEDEITAFIRQKNHDMVVDATHPYATEISKNAAAAASRAGVPYFRLVRPVAASDGLDCIHVSTTVEAAERCNKLEGNILITTGAKELSAFTITERVFVRVLPLVESIRTCIDLGVRSDHIIAMQGPFSHELNVALMRQFAIRILVTKDGGTAGGTKEKISAAKEVDATVIMIDRPSEPDGYDFETIVSLIQHKLERTQ